MDILRIATAGSVDDGKSTLIGRLLYETNSITGDKIEALQAASKRKGLNFLDLSLLTDGLIAEREQGITIDVAHIYFSTPKRKYIIADTPGHFEYTRNMVTGASNTSVSIILIDARNGVVEQTKRHFYISSMLRVKNIIVAVNKMDLLNDNQVNPISHLPARFPVQVVVRPKTDEFHDYRGYAGKIASGSFLVGDLVEALPSGQISKIKTIEKFGKNLEIAHARESVVITLENDIDISRGNMIVKVGQQPEAKKEIEAKVCWLDSHALKIGKTYLLQHGINRVKAKVISINSMIDIKNMTLDTEPSHEG